MNIPHYVRPSFASSTGGRQDFAAVQIKRTAQDAGTIAATEGHVAFCHPLLDVDDACGLAIGEDVLVSAKELAVALKGTPRGGYALLVVTGAKVTLTFHDEARRETGTAVLNRIQDVTFGDWQRLLEMAPRPGTGGTVTFGLDRAYLEALLKCYTKKGYCGVQTVTFTVDSRQEVADNVVRLGFGENGELPSLIMPISVDVSHCAPSAPEPDGIPEE